MSRTWVPGAKKPDQSTSSIRIWPRLAKGVSIVPPAKVVGCGPSASPEKFSLPAVQVGFGFSMPPLAAYDTHSSWLLKAVPSERTRFVHPPFWHALALAELPPPAVAVATPTESDTASTAAATSQ